LKAGSGYWSKQSFERRDAEWADLATAGKNVDSVVSYRTDDAVVMEPGQPAVEGKAAIRNYVAESFKTPGFKIHWVSEKPTFSPDGKFAYMRGHGRNDRPRSEGSADDASSSGVFDLAPGAGWSIALRRRHRQ
jgi:ketosteroid isomerase-like protein